YTVHVIGANGCSDTLSQTLGPFCPLAVEYLGLEAEGKLDHILLQWETLAEPYNEGFAVERSIDRVGFEEIAWVQSQSKFGEGQVYQFQDREVETGREYFYRLKQLDLEGQMFYSDVQTARLELLHAAQLLRVYPNPTREQFQLEMYTPEPSQLEFLLFNQLGQQLVKKSFELKGGVTNLTLSSNEWAEGVYLVQLRTAHGYSEEFRITKIR
ncbi:MAG: T9SS type A sorting domain-containing protein, partial [Bacteroidota bacterium]